MVVTAEKELLVVDEELSCASKKDDKDEISQSPSVSSVEYGPPYVHSGSKPRWICFILAWLAYAGLTALRKPLGVGKKPLAADLKLGKTQLGFLDMSFLMPYAIVQVTVGSQADKVQPRLVLFGSLLVSSLSMLTFGSWSSIYPLALLLLLGGSAQAFAWPACVKLISGWFPGRASSNVFGLYGTCTSVGGVAGTMVAVYLLGWSWRHSFWPQSLFVLALSLVVLMFLPSPPPDNSVPAKESTSSVPGASHVNTLNLLKIQSVAELCCANFMIKMVRYAFFMWLPMYLSEELSFSDGKAGMMSTTFEIGGFVGTLFSGAIIDRVFGGQLISCVSGLLLVGCVSIGLFIATSTFGTVFNCATLFLAGAANVATDPIVSAMIPMAIAELEQSNIKAGLASILNGMGSVGVILEGPLIGAVADLFGWSACIYLLAALQVLSLFMVRWAARHKRTVALS